MQRQISSLAGLMSVITPTHNSCHLLRRVVESVAAQTVPVYEHIVIDDGSTDDTFQVLNELVREFPHLLVLTQKRAGAAAARNKGIEVARGRYIAFLDADDLWYEHKVEEQLRFMEEQNCVFSYGDYEEVDHQHLHPMKYYNLPDEVGHSELLYGCPIGCLTAAYNQEVLGKRYMPRVKTGHDWGLWLELSREGIVARKYPGLAASYSNGAPSLSGKKFVKFTHIYRIYRISEGLAPLSAVLHTIIHSMTALLKKAGLIYKYVV